MKIAQQDTAIAAYYERVPQIRPGQNDRVLACIRACGPLTISEIAKITEIDKSAVSRAQGELRAAGLLEWGDERKSSVSGVTCNTLRLPVRQLESC